jgi:hypothetical protein
MNCTPAPSKACRSAATVGPCDAVGPCPKELAVHGSEWELFRDIHCSSSWWNHPRDVPRFPWDFFAEPDSSGQVWNVAVLEASVQAARVNLGPAGRMPKVIRHLRDLIPVATAREATRDWGNHRFNTDGLSKAANEANEAALAAEKPILELPSLTLAGVAVKARLAAYRLAEWSRHESGAKQSAYLTSVVDAVLSAAGST